MPTSERKFAFLIKTSPEQTSQTVTSLEQAFDLADAGYEVKIYLDGAGTAWAKQLVEDSDTPVAPYLAEAIDRNLVKGACGLCAVKFDSVDTLQSTDIEILGDETEHSIDTAQLAADGFELLIVS
jgi:predicted peroxiredoxin